MATNRERLLRIAERDHSININEFDSFIKSKYQNTSAAPSPQVNKAPSQEEELFAFNAIRGASSRPGMGPPSFVKDVLRNRVDINEDYEVWRTDPIPLKTYKKMSFDPELAFGVFLLKGWVGGLPYEIKCRDKKMKGIVEMILQDKWRLLVSDLLDSIESGFAFGEKVWERKVLHVPDPSRPDKFIYKGPIANLKNIKFLDPENNFIFYKRNDELVRIEQQQMLRKVSVDRSKLVWFALDKKFSGIFGRARFKNAYSAWYYSEVIEKYMLSDLQKRGSPHIEVRYPRGSSEVNGQKIPNSQVAEMLAKQLTSQGYVVLPSEHNEKTGESLWSIKYADNHQQSTNPYVEVLTRLNEKKLKAIGVPPSVAGGANFSAADAGADLLMIVIEDIVTQIEEVIQKEIVDYIVDYNFGPEHKPLVRLKIDKNALGRKDLIKELLKTMLRTGTSIQGHTLREWPDVPSMARELGVTSATFEEVFLEKEGMGRKPGETLIDETERDEDSNDTDVHRGEEDDRNRGRPTERDDATST